MSFQKRVFEVVKKIPKGKVLTYKQIAERAGSPKAYRSVGNILNKNRNPKIPCHRVILSSGLVGGFAKGAKKKVRLLKDEGLKIKGDRRCFP